MLKENIIILFQQGTTPSKALAVTVYLKMCHDLMNPYVLLPPALFAQLYGINDVLCNSTMNSEFVSFIILISDDPSISFFYGMDVSAIKQNEYDLATVVMHEIIHGMGFFTSIDENGYFAEMPRVGIFDRMLYNFTMDVPLWKIDDAAVINLTNNQLQFPLSSPLFLYSKFPFLAGTSGEHTMHGIMSYKLGRGVTYRTLDIFILRIMKLMGYQIQNCEHPDMAHVCGNCDASVFCYVSNASNLISFFHYFT